MSYHRRRHPSPMGNVVVDFFTDPVKDVASYVGNKINPSEAECTAKMDTATANLDALTSELARDWKPTGFYLVADMARMRDEVWKVMTSATAAIERVIADGVTAPMRATLGSFMDGVYRKMREGLTFSTAISTAQTKGLRLIDAPGFKRWTIESLNKASSAIAAAAYMSCLKPAIVAVVQKLVAAWQTMIQIGKAMVRVAVAAGEQFLRIPDTFQTIWTVTKWGTLAVGAAWLLAKARKPPAK